MIDVWEDLVAGALVGTDRRPLDLAAEGVLGAALAGLGPNPNPLDAAAVLWAYREVGQLPPTAAPPPTPAGTDDRPPPTSGAVGALRSMLEHPAYHSLLGEWLALAERAGRRLPPELVPDLLDAAPVALRPIVARLAGPLGAWLGERNPDWAWATGEADGGGPEVLERRWQEEGDGSRLAALAQLRRVDPDRARRLVAGTWRRDPPSVRQAVLDLLAASVSQEDESLLEAALDDRRRDIRRHAALLLARLPGSAWAARMAARAVPLVRVEGRLRPRLVLGYPTEVDTSMARDGVETPPKGWGERQWWLRQVVAGTPLTAWEKSLGRSPSQLVDLAATAPEPAIALTTGWLAAVGNQRNLAWARALLPVGVTKDLLAVLPAGEADAVVIDRLVSRGLPASLSVLTDGPLSVPVSGAVIGGLATMVTSTDLGEAVAVRAQLDRLARTLDVAVAEGAIATLAAALEAIPADKTQVGRPFWDRALGALMATLNFRCSLWAELTGTGATP